VRRRAAFALLGIVAALALVPGVAFAQDTAVCGEADHPAGEWPAYGADRANSRSQPLSTELGPDAVGSLQPAFVYEAPGLINNTPLVDGGCIFVASQGATTTTGVIAALDADDGTEIWSTEIDAGQPAFGGPIVGSPALKKNLVITPVNRQGSPFLIAHDRQTGEERWSTTIDTQEMTGVNASAVVYDGMVFIGFFGNAGPGTHERGGFALLDASTGELLKKTYVIDDASFEEGYAGAGVWATPAIDRDTGFAYVGTSNPHNPHKEHARSNSILKIDLNRESADFGEIVASYKGMHDTVVEGASDQPVCETKDDVYYYSRFSVTCLAVDLDFGASPNLFTASDGRKLVGELQKAGIYHVVDAGDMSEVSQTHVGAPCFACNAGSSAFADGHAFVAAGPPGQMVAVNGDDGLPAWVSPIAGGFTYNAVSVANGVVWSVDSTGFLNAYDQSTGVPLAKRSLRDDTGVSMVETTTSSGVAIARNTLYTAATTFVIAYRPTS
jgi:polyvinyl alcohol dehydrogenase (cytochrome)